MQFIIVVCNNKLLLIIGGEKTQEPLTITNAANELLDFSDKWIMVASLLCLPDSVRNYIGVSRNKDNKGALKKTVEWWFMNNPNPEWDEIQRIKGMWLYS